MKDYSYIGNRFKIEKNCLIVDKEIYLIAQNVPDNFIEIKGYATIEAYYSIRQFGFQIVAIEVEEFDIELYDGSMFTIFAKDEDEVEKIKNKNNIY